MSAGANETAVTNPQERYKGRVDVRRVTATETLSEVDSNKMLVITSAAADITLTLPSAETCIGSVIQGIVQTSAGTNSLILTAATVGQLLCPSSGTVYAENGTAVTLPLVSVGTCFRAFSTGLKWVLQVSGKNKMNILAVTASATLAALDTTRFLSITSASTDITITLPDAASFAGYTFKGGVAVSAGSNSLIVTGTTVGQLLVKRVTIDANTPTLAGTVSVVAGTAITLLKVVAGTTFVAFSDGSKWFVDIVGKVNSA